MLTDNTFFFFTEAQFLLSQNAAKAFGPVEGGPEKRFRTCSLHQSSQPPPAYAICKGQICVLEVDDLHLNLVLKPMQQPHAGLPTIKYFIYRGIQKNTLLDPTSNAIAARGTNDLVDSLWASYDNNFRVFGAEVEPPAKTFLGLGLPQEITATDQLDLIFRYGAGDYQLPYVRAGWNIGQFDANSFGLEIVLDEVTSNPTLSSVSQLDHMITSPGPTADPWTTRQKEEQILAYLDPCAFFASFFHATLFLGPSNERTPIDQSNFAEIILSKFWTHKRLYVDIRSELLHSFNYLQNYDDHLEIDIHQTGNFIQKNYYESGWPLMIIEEADFENISTASSNMIPIDVSLPLGGNLFPRAFYQQRKHQPATGKISTESTFATLERNETDGRTSTVPLTVFRHPDGDAPLCTYQRLQYYHGFSWGKSLGGTAVAPLFERYHHFDLLFRPFVTPLRNAIEIGNQYFTKVYYSDICIDNAMNQEGERAVFWGFSLDENLVTFFYFPRVSKGKRLQNQTFPIPITDDAMNSAGFLDNLEKRFQNLQLVKYELNTSIPTPYLKINQDIEERNELLSSAFNNLSMLQISRNDYQDFLRLLDTSGFIHPGDVYLNLDLQDHGIDLDGYEFTVYQAVLKGLAREAGGNIHIKSIPTQLNFRIVQDKPQVILPPAEPPIN